MTVSVETPPGDTKPPEGDVCLSVHTRLERTNERTNGTGVGLNYTHSCQSAVTSGSSLYPHSGVVCVPKRDVYKKTYLTEREAAQLSRWAEEAGKSESALLREAVLEYLDRDRADRIEDKLDAVLARLPEDGLDARAEPTHTHKPDTPMNQSGSKATEKARRIIQRLQSNHDAPVIQADAVDRAIEDIAGVDDRTIRKYKSLFRRRGLLFEHPGASAVWTFDTDQFMTWLRNYAQLNGQQAAEEVADAYPVSVYASTEGIQIELAEVDQ